MENPMKILVVDDEQVIRDLFTRILSIMKHEVTSVLSGEEAIKKAQEEDFDIVFLDIMLPGKDGVETMREIRKINPKIKVVMMTGFSVQDKVDTALAEGAYKALKKPFDIVEIKGAIDEILKTETKKGAKILVVDDEKVIHDLFKRVSKINAHNINLAKGAEEAIELLEKDGFDIIFLDMKLPGLSGYEAYKKIKNLKPDAEIVTMTGYYEYEKEMEKACREGAFNSIRKPFDVKLIIELIEKIAAKKAGKKK